MRLNGLWVLPSDFNPQGSRICRAWSLDIQLPRELLKEQLRRTNATQLCVPGSVWGNWQAGEHELWGEFTSDFSSVSILCPCNCSSPNSLSESQLICLSILVLFHLYPLFKTFFLIFFCCGPLFKSLYGMSYNIASVLCLGFLATRHVGS